jgi:hypothetical protein
MNKVLTAGNPIKKPCDSTIQLVVLSGDWSTLTAPCYNPACCPVRGLIQIDGSAKSFHKADSKQEAINSSVPSDQGLLMNCRPIGRPFESWPTGTDRAGSPVKFAFKSLQWMWARVTRVWISQLLQSSKDTCVENSMLFCSFKQANFNHEKLFYCF